MLRNLIERKKVAYLIYRFLLTKLSTVCSYKMFVNVLSVFSQFEWQVFGKNEKCYHVFCSS